MKTTIETLDFPSDIKKKLKMKVSTSNLDIKFLSGHIIKFNKTNLSVREPHRIIVSNLKNTLIALLYDDIEKVYLPRENAIVSFTKYITILNTMNGFK
ncbi:MAG: hypothetical protein HFI87_02905 [Bacilli bacterium]|nr:hypothetical protein [Bacilli bacterium]